MTPRMRMTQVLVVGLFGLAFISYYYYTNSIEFDRFSILSSLRSSRIASFVVSSQNPINRIEEIAQTSGSTDNTKLAEPTASSSPLVHEANNMMKTQKEHQLTLRPKSEVKRLFNYSSGKLTADLYVSGHDIPNVELCPNRGDKLKVLIVITSAPQHSAKRMAIRKTWGHYGQRNDLSIGFLLGSSTEAKIDVDVRYESGIYRDIIHSRFIDTYSNLTLKSVSLMEWVDNYCTEVKFVLKTDDDMFINIPKLLLFIEKHSNKKRVIYGRLAHKWGPVRNTQSKYYLSPQEYSLSLFPDFVTGPAYLLTGDIVHDLYTTSLSRNFLKMEDVFITGILAVELNVSRISAHEFANYWIAYDPCVIENYISVHEIPFDGQFDLWRKTEDGVAMCG